MNTRAKTERMIDALNARVVRLQPDQVQWNTPGAYFLESYRPGNRRIYQLTRNCRDGGSTTLISGELKEVRTFVEAMILGYDIGKPQFKGI